ncbi:Vacuolar protein sorting-associated protein 68 [Metarhizium acridum]|nr:Vacuolar protein sorting-associated protein 68 [Metarhizium acridum]
MLDSAVWSKSARNGSNVHVKFVDWLPLVFSSLGMLIINSVEKTRLSADSFSYSGSGVAWKARVVLFLGFAALAGGMAGGRHGVCAQVCGTWWFLCLRWEWALRTS